MGNQQGAFAEMLTARVETIAFKPANGIYKSSRGLGDHRTDGPAFQSLRDLGGLKRTNTRVLITGVSGGVGSIAVGIAEAAGRVSYRCRFGKGFGTGPSARRGNFVG